MPLSVIYYENNQSRDDMIVSDEYRDEYDALIADPTLQKLADEVRGAVAAEVLSLSDLTGWTFMASASDEYHKRGGTEAHSIGGPAEAIRALVDPDYNSPFKSRKDS